MSESFFVSARQTTTVSHEPRLFEQRVSLLVPHAECAPIAVSDVKVELSDEALELGKFLSCRMPWPLVRYPPSRALYRFGGTDEVS